MKSTALKVLTISVVVASIAFMAVIYFNRYYKVDVEVCGGRLLSATPSQVASQVQKTIEGVRFVLKTPEGEERYEFANIGLSLTLDVDGLEKLITEQTFLRSIDCTGLLSLSIDDPDKLRGVFASLNDNPAKSKDARLKRGDSWFQLLEETYGNEVVVDLLLERLYGYVDNENVLYRILDSGKLKFVVSDDDYVKPAITTNDFERILEELERYQSWRISYTNGFTLGGGELYPYLKLDSDGGVKFQEKKFREKYYPLLMQNLSSYTTVGRERSFVGHSGKKKTVSGGTYGDRVDFAKEFKFLLKSIKKVKSHTDRVPTLEFDLPDKIGKTFIEVSIAKQHLWYYEKGKLKMETDIVTGRAGKYDTPKGIYYISEKIPGKYLVGEGYRTWVNYWMRLTNTGIGLHDASWRRSFGKNIYSYNGSHGCINLPKDFAKELYATVQTRLTVIVH